MFKNLNKYLKIGLICIMGFIFFKVSSFLLAEENKCQLVVQLQSPVPDTYQVYWASKENAYEGHKFANFNVQGSDNFQTSSVPVKSEDSISYIRLDLGNNPQPIKIKIKDITIINHNLSTVIQGKELHKYFYMNGYVIYDSTQSTLSTRLVPEITLPYDPFICSKNLNQMNFQSTYSMNYKVYLFTLLFTCFVTFVIFKLF